MVHWTDNAQQGLLLNYHSSILYPNFTVSVRTVIKYGLYFRITLFTLVVAINSAELYHPSITSCCMCDSSPQMYPTMAQLLEGTTVKDCVNITFEGRYSDGNFTGSIDSPGGGD